MRSVQVFETKNNIKAINALLSELQFSNDNNRVLSVDRSGSKATVLASVELDIGPIGGPM